MYVIIEWAFEPQVADIDQIYNTQAAAEDAAEFFAEKNNKRRYTIHKVDDTPVWES